MDLTQIDRTTRETVARTFRIAGALAAEIMYVNDDDVDDFVWEKVEICGPLRRWGKQGSYVQEPEPARRGSQMGANARMGCGSHQARQRVMDDFVKALNRR